jgi:gluconate 2-dehydrogenase gamma chain
MKTQPAKRAIYRDQQLQALSISQARRIDAIAARIFPTTDTPGAVEAGAVFYLDQALAGPYPELLSFYAKALRALDHHAKEKFRGDFTTLPKQQQDSVLKDFEAGAVPKFAKAAAFFEMARAHILEGVFGEPNYGGNKDLIGWRLVGFPGQQYGYSDPYINKVVDMEPVACQGMPKKADER